MVIDNLGRVLIPKELREKLGLAVGTQVCLEEAPGGGLLLRAEQPAPPDCSGVGGRPLA